MKGKNLKRKMLLSLALLVFSLSLFVFASYAWFTGKFEDWVNVEIGFVEAEVDLYFVDEFDQRVEALEVEIVPTVFKDGVYSVNIVSPLGDYYFEDLRLKVLVTSNVPTYFRIQTYEQLTLTYINYDDSITELSILIDGYMPFHYDMTNWHDNRDYDNFLYYKNPVMRVDESTAWEFLLISSEFSGDEFSDYSPGYSLQFGFTIEAVQAEGGPENVWELATTPWGTAW